MTPLPPTPDRYRSGDVLAGKYRLVRLIGSGGMGAVWLARNEVLDVEVALKLLRLDGAHPDAQARLLQEARAAARLGHPSIVRVFDFGETDGRDPFIVMELLQGESLGDQLARKERLDALLAVQTVLPIAGALVAAHKSGIVHRDLKPANVIVARDDRGARIPKLLDFGIAKLSGTELPANVTKEGEVIGSPAYLSPQQARGAPVDARTDVWSLGVLIYELIAGRPPFSGASYEALIAAILMDEPQPLNKLGYGDGALWSILERALAKEPAARWPSMQDFGAALSGWAISKGAAVDVAGNSLHAHWIAGARPQASLPPPARRRRVPIAAAIALLSALGLGVGLLLAPREPRSAPLAVATPPALPIGVAVPAPVTPPTAAPAPAQSALAPAASSTVATAVKPAPRRGPEPPKPARGGEMPVPAQPNF